jgi:hypothetical protein
LVIATKSAAALLTVISVPAAPIDIQPQRGAARIGQICVDGVVVRKALHAGLLQFSGPLAFFIRRIWRSLGTMHIPSRKCRETHYS